MRALTVAAFGAPGLTRIAHKPKPVAHGRDVLIRAVAAGVNPVDWKEIDGHLEQFYGAYEADWIPGYDVAGIVEAVGPEATGFAAGDRVVAFSDRRENGHNGTFADYVRVLAEAVALVPPEVGLDDAAALPTAALTGYQALVRPRKAGLRRGEAVFVHGASGGVGSYAVQIARALGLRVVASCSRSNLAYVRSLGAEHVLDYAEGGLAAAVRTWRPQGVAAIIDCVSGGTLPDALDALQPGGRWISIATLTQDGDIAGDAASASARGFAKIISIMEFDRIGDELRELLAMMRDGALKPPPLTVFPLEDSPIALDRMRQGHVRGKIVLRMSHTEQ